MERKLATIRKIENLEPIEGKDLIELATLDGWQAIVKKGEYTIGDLVVYCEIDSFLPVKEEYEFLRSRCFKSTKNLGDGFRIKSMKMGGVLSQGLVLPLSIINDFDKSDITVEEDEDTISFELPLGKSLLPLNVGDDVTELLGIQKYEQPIPANLAGKVRGNFPSFIPKTDQERCLPYNSLILTKDFGYLSIKDIVDNKMSIDVESYNHTTNTIEFKRVSNWSSLSNKNVWVKIKLKSGKELVCTENHKIWCDDILAYREAKDIIKGQKFIIKTEDTSEIFTKY